MKKAIVAGLLMLGALLAGIYQAMPTSSGVDDVLDQKGVVLFSRPLPVRAAAFTDQQGQAVSLASFHGKNLLVFFGYTFCPDICPTTLMDLSRTWKQLPDEVKQQWQVILVSVDPARDTPESLAPYMGYFNKAFVAFSGNGQSLSQLAADLNAVYQRVDRGDAAYLMDHSANLAVLDSAGHYRGYIAPPHNAARMVPLLQALSR